MPTTGSWQRGRTGHDHQTGIHKRTVMGKEKRVRSAGSRAAKQRRRQHRKDQRQAPVEGLPGGWHTGFDDADFAMPDEQLLDTSRCPVAEVCAGCGATTGLRAVTAAFSESGGFNLAWTTLCGGCEGSSFLHLLDASALEQAFARHTTHQP
ncbi:hypothetical protein [Saccharopolyspora shandongensis]|uniref:hypothetical protein n=1 Tax=Saccharopolyspora shandongensis TaxID=418495 RepID=UPI0033E73C7C